MWPLYLTQVVHIDRRNETATKGQVLSVLEDPWQELRLNPLAISVKQDEHDPTWFTITDRLPLFCGLESTTIFRCSSKRVNLENEQGTDNEVWAGLGTRLRCERRIEELDALAGAESSEKEVWFREKVVLQRTMIRGHLTAIEMIETRAAQEPETDTPQKSRSLA